MYLSKIYETGQGTYRLEIRNGNNELVYAAERGTHDKARQEQLKFLVKGPNIGPRKADASGLSPRGKRIERDSLATYGEPSESEEPSKEAMSRREHATPMEATDSEYHGHDYPDNGDGNVFE